MRNQENSGRVSAVFFLLTFQNPHHRKDCVPIARRRRSTKQFIQLTKIADCLHAATVLSKNKTTLQRNNANMPLPGGWNCNWELNADVSRSRKNANEADNVRARGRSFEWIVHLQSQDIAVWAEHNVRLERKLSDQFCVELRSRSRLSNYKSACSPNVHDIVVAQFFSEEAWAKGPVPTDIDASDESDERHRVVGVLPAYSEVFYSRATQAGHECCISGTAWPCRSERRILWA